MGQRDAHQAVEIAQSILDGSVPLVLGCKRLVGPLARLGVHHQAPFVTITGVDSETDDVPVWPSERAMWNKERLAEEDAKLANWIPKIERHVYEACQAVIVRFGGV